MSFVRMMDAQILDARSLSMLQPSFLIFFFLLFLGLDWALWLVTESGKILGCGYRSEVQVHVLQRYFARLS